MKLHHGACKSAAQAGRGSAQALDSPPGMHRQGTSIRVMLPHRITLQTKAKNLPQTPTTRHATKRGPYKRPPWITGPDHTYVWTALKGSASYPPLPEVRRCPWTAQPAHINVDSPIGFAGRPPPTPPRPHLKIPLTKYRGLAPLHSGW